MPSESWHDFVCIPLGVLLASIELLDFFLADDHVAGILEEALAELVHWVQADRLHLLDLIIAFHQIQSFPRAELGVGRALVIELPAVFVVVNELPAEVESSGSV